MTFYKTEKGITEDKSKADISFCSKGCKCMTKTFYFRATKILICAKCGAGK